MKLIVLVLAWWFLSFDTHGGWRAQGPFMSREGCEEIRTFIARQRSGDDRRLSPCWRDGKS